MLLAKPSIRAIKKLTYVFTLVFLLLNLLSACDSGQQGEPHQPEDSAEHALKTPKTLNSVDWPQHGLNSSEDRFSSLAQITKENVKSLGLSWFIDLPTKRGQESTPIVVDGTMYTSSAWSHVLAINPVSGETLWHYDPKINKAYGAKGCCDAVNRGVAVDQGKVFVGALDGRLIALDAKTGEELWSTLTVDQSKAYTITGAPRVANSKVFIGNGGAEFGVRGYISAYDANTGKLVWRFYTVPGAPGEPTGTEPVEAQTATWSGSWWENGGGGTVWDSMAVDLETNTLFFGVGNGSPWNPKLRSDGKGDNWFLSSIVAVDLDNGAYKWHYQTTPQEAWDFTATQHMILADMDFDGKSRKVLMQAPKNGFFYILDRTSGELLSAEPYVKTNWATHVDMETGRPEINPKAKYWITGEPAVVTPSWMGGHNWHPMSYNHQTGLVYIPAHESSYPYVGVDSMTRSDIGVNLGVSMAAPALPDIPEVIEQVKQATNGHLLAWDPIEQKEVWRVQYPGAWNGGVLSTAGGLIFQGSATGYMNAYSAESGEQLWQYPVQTGVVAPPITYQIDGEQYLTVSAGWGGIFPLMTGPLNNDSANGDPINRSRLLTFKLGASAALPTAEETLRELPDYSAITLDKTKIEKGAYLFESYCTACHGTGAVGGGVIPDLRYSAMTASEVAWKSVVYDGVLSQNGMISFAAELSEEDIENIRQFVIGRNQFARSIGDTSRLSR